MWLRFLVANVAGQQVDRVIARLARAGIDVRTTEQGFEGFWFEVAPIDLGFRFQLTDATICQRNLWRQLVDPRKHPRGCQFTRSNNVKPGGNG